MAVNKVIYGTTVLVDLTEDTVTADKLVRGYTAHDKSGALITGTAVEGVDMPTFSIVWDSSYETRTVTCDETFAECFNRYYNSDTRANVYICVDDAEHPWEDYRVAIALDASGSEFITYAVEEVYGPAYDIVYSADGTISIVDPSSYNRELTATQNGDYWPDMGVFSHVVVNVPATIPSLQTKTATPTTSQQVITPDSGYDGLSQVTVSAMPTGTAGTPTATKGIVSNHSVSVTPSVTNVTGYIEGSTKNGTAVSVSASELVSGSQTLTDNGTVDVTNLASITVDIDFVTYHVSSSEPTSSQGSNGDIWLVTE